MVAVQTSRHLSTFCERYPPLAGLAPRLCAATTLICASYRQGGTVLVCGNGGSAADSEHIVGELMKGFCLRRPVPEEDIAKLTAVGVDDAPAFAGKLQQAVPAIALTGHIGLSTAVQNDNDPAMVFAQQVYGYGKPGDVLIGLSTSGNARNVVNALDVARAFGLATIGFTGCRPSLMDDRCTVLFKAPAQETYQVQEQHLPLYHCLCLMVEEQLFTS